MRSVGASNTSGLVKPTEATLVPELPTTTSVRTVASRRWPAGATVSSTVYVPGEAGLIDTVPSAWPSGSPAPPSVTTSSAAAGPVTSGTGLGVIRKVAPPTGSPNWSSLVMSSWPQVGSTWMPIAPTKSSSEDRSSSPAKERTFITP